MQEPEDKRLLIRYLLEDLNEEAQDRVEERYFADDSFYNTLLVTEDELIDAYVLGELLPDEKAKFEQVYLTNPHKRKRIESSEILLDLITKPLLAPTPKRQSFISSLLRVLPGRNISLHYSLAGLLVFGILFGLLCWLMIERARMRGELEQARPQWQHKEDKYQGQLAALEQPAPISGTPNNMPLEDSTVGIPNERQTNDKGPPEQAKKRSGPATPKESVARARGPFSVVAFAILRSGVRAPNGDTRAGNPLIIPRKAVLVQMTVDLERNENTVYKIYLQKVGGGESWSQTVRRNSPVKRIKVAVPSAFFRNGVYLLKVTGSDSLDDEQILAFHQISALNRNLGAKQTDDATQR